MRWQVLLQASVGVGALFGFAYLAVERKIAPIVHEESLERAASEARVATLELERSWMRSRQTLENAALALARTPTFQSLGEVFPRERRSEGLAQALKTAVEQIGGEGRAALFDARGRALDGAAALEATSAVQEALQGVIAVRVERIDEAPFEVVAVPIYERSRNRGQAPSEAGVGVLALARPLARARLGHWTRNLPSSTVVVILNGTEPLVSLLPFDRLSVVRPERLPPQLALNGVDHAVSEIRLSDGGSRGLRGVALAPIHGPRGAAAIDAVRLLVVGLGGITFLLLTALLLLAPSRTKPAAVSTPQKAPPRPDEAPAPAEVRPEPPPSLAEGPLSSGTVPPVVRPNAAGTYSGVPTSAAEALPVAARDFDASPHSSGAFDALPEPPGSVGAFEHPQPPPTLSSAPYPSLPPQSLAPSGSSGVGFDLRQSEASSARPAGSGSYPAAPRPVPVPSALRGSGAYPAAGRSTGSFPPARDASAKPVPVAPVPPAEAPPAMARSPNFSAGRPSPEAADLSGPPPFAMRPESGFDQSSDDPEPHGFDARLGQGVPGSPASGLEAPSSALPPPTLDDHNPSFDAIFRAAQTTAPAAPSSGDPDENLPVPKGGLSPGMIVATDLARQGPVMAPSPRLEGNLPLPKEQAPHLYDLSPTPPDRTGPRGAPGLGPGSVSTGLSSPNVSNFAAQSGKEADVAQPFDTEHYRRVYDEFVAAKGRLGESVEGLSFEGFGAKLRASEEGLIQRHACRAVRFQVLVKDQAVSLRPQLVR